MQWGELPESPKTRQQITSRYLDRRGTPSRRARSALQSRFACKEPRRVPVRLDPAHSSERGFARSNGKKPWAPEKRGLPNQNEYSQARLQEITGFMLGENPRAPGKKNAHESLLICGAHNFSDDRLTCPIDR